MKFLTIIGLLSIFSLVLCSCPKDSSTNIKNKSTFNEESRRTKDNNLKVEIKENWTDTSRQIESKFTRIQDEFTLDSGLYLENNRALVEGYFPRVGTDFRVSPLGLINLDTNLISPLDVPSDCYRPNDTNQPTSLLTVVKGKGNNTAVVQLKTELVELPDNKHILKTKMFEIYSNGRMVEILTLENAVLVDTLSANRYLFSRADWFSLEETGAFLPHFDKVDNGFGKFIIVDNDKIVSEFQAPLQCAVNPSGTKGAFIYPSYQRPETVAQNLVYANLTKNRIRLRPFIKGAKTNHMAPPTLSESEANDIMSMKGYLFAWINDEILLIHTIGNQTESDKGQNAFKICKAEINGSLKEIGNMAYSPIVDFSTGTLAELSISGQTDPPVFQLSFVDVFNTKTRKYLLPVNEYEYVTPLFFLGEDTLVLNADPTMEASKKYTKDKKPNAITGLIFLKLSTKADTTIKESSESK